PALLIGIHHFWDTLLSNDCYYRQLNGLHIFYTTIGGIVCSCPIEAVHCTLTSTRSEDLSVHAHQDRLLELVEKFWEVGNIGIMDNLINKDDE
ncbi:hypothetical protein Angca_001312, partial [Angiostrongylus cantonensis]